MGSGGPARAVLMSMQILISKALRFDGSSLLYIVIRGDDSEDTSVSMDLSLLIHWVAHAVSNSPFDDADKKQMFIRRAILEALCDDQVLFDVSGRKISVNWMDTIVLDILSACDRINSAIDVENSPVAQPRPE